MTRRSRCCDSSHDCLFNQISLDHLNGSLLRWDSDLALRFTFFDMTKSVKNPRPDSHMNFHSEPDIPYRTLEAINLHHGNYWLAVHGLTAEGYQWSQFLYVPQGRSCHYNPIQEAAGIFDAPRGLQRGIWHGFQACWLRFTQGLGLKGAQNPEPSTLNPKP